MRIQRMPGFTAEASLEPAIYTYASFSNTFQSVNPSETIALQADKPFSLYKPFVVRVFDPQGKPVHGAEVIVTPQDPRVLIGPKLSRGRTVNSLWQSYVPCSSYNPLNPFPPYNVDVEVWSIHGILRGRSFYVSTNSWQCDYTEDLEFRY